MISEDYQPEDSVQLLPIRQDRLLRRIASMGGAVYSAELFMTGVAKSFEQLQQTLCDLKAGGYILTAGARPNTEDLRNREIYLTDMGQVYVSIAPKSDFRLTLNDVFRRLTSRPPIRKTA